MTDREGRPCFALACLEVPRLDKIPVLMGWESPLAKATVTWAQSWLAISRLAPCAEAASGKDAAVLTAYWSCGGAAAHGAGASHEGEVIDCH